MDMSRCNCKLCNEVECCDCGRPLVTDEERTTGVCERCEEDIEDEFAII